MNTILFMCFFTKEHFLLILRLCPHVNEFACQFTQHPNFSMPLSPTKTTPEDEMSLAMPWGSKVLPRWMG